MEDGKWRNTKANYQSLDHARGLLHSHQRRPHHTPLRRVLWVVTALAACLFYLWKWILHPEWIEEQEYLEGFRTSLADSVYFAKNSPFQGTKLLDLDPNLLPGGVADPGGIRRLVFVGDIHGCANELHGLLRKLKFDSATDHLIAVGDVVSKGPDSAGALDQLIRNNATSVRGNHEDRVLDLARSIDDAATSVPDSPSGTSSQDSELLRQLFPHHLEYLQRMPLMLRIPSLPLARKVSAKASSPIGEEILVVHAGLVPAVALGKQDPFFVMNMRAIHTKTHRPFVEAESKKAKTKPWHDIWCWYNERLFKHKTLKDFQVLDGDSGLDSPVANVFRPFTSLGWLQSGSKTSYPQPQVVIYGHRSKEGLQLERWTKGLDTGCVNGGKLTAFVLGADGRHDIVQVQCGDYNS